MLNIKELTPNLKGEFLQFFDCDAFSDNPKWASCYCHFPHALHRTEKWAERTAAQNREATSKLIESEYMTGYLAYVDDKPVGWCNANIQSRYTILKDATEDIGAIVCFIVAKPHRGTGVATRLLDAACEGLRKRGVRAIEAYPRKADTTQAGNYHGPLEMYLRAGFEPIREEDGVVVVRRDFLL
jgi:GNAT superfamily N-acetyltransferase